MEYQKIIRNTGLFDVSNCIVDNMIKIYQIYSNTLTIDKTTECFSVDVKSKPYINSLENGLQRNLKYKYCNTEWYGDYNPSGDKIVVCFSGGKDSTALAKKLIDEGEKIILFHVHGINKSYPHELEHAKELARYLGVDIYIDTVSLVGKTNFLENPTKNQLLCSLALMFSLKNGYSHKIAFGDFTTDVQSTSLFDRNWSDSKECWSGFFQYVRNYIDDFELIIPFNSYLDSFDIITKDTVLLSKIQSCILPDRFRDFTRKKNEKKYNIKLPNNRCGSCWKCCTEWIILVNKGIINYNKDFYEHCLEFLKNKQKSEFPDLMEINTENAYKLFIKSDFKDSLYYKREKS